MVSRRIDKLSFYGAHSITPDSPDPRPLTLITLTLTLITLTVTLITVTLTVTLTLTLTVTPTQPFRGLEIVCSRVRQGQY